MKIGFIGAGKVGCTLAKYFAAYKIPIAGFYSQSYASALTVANFTASKAYSAIDQLAKECDCLLITVPDHQIASVWLQLSQLPLNNKWVGHCSGSLTSELFVSHNGVYPYGFSLHPLYAIYDKFTCYRELTKAYFTLEANQTVTAQLMKHFSVLPNSIGTIDADKKALYHAACVMLSNHVIALAQVGSEMLKQSGLDSQFSEQAWHQLFLGNAKSLCQLGPASALTGPIERGDSVTINRHLAVLPPDIKPLYQQLSAVLIKISQQKHPNRDYKPLQQELRS